MSSERRIAACRANGALSTGPKTEEGRQRSSLNAMRHGLLSKHVVVQGESAENFESVLQQHEERFVPADQVEQGFIEEMAASFWRMRRLWAIETRTFNKAVAGSPHEDSIDSIAAAFDALATTPQLGLMHRYETRLHRIYQRAMNNLIKLRQFPPAKRT